MSIKAKRTNLYTRRG